MRSGSGVTREEPRQGVDDGHAGTGDHQEGRPREPSSSARVLSRAAPPGGRWLTDPLQVQPSHPGSLRL